MSFFLQRSSITTSSYPSYSEVPFDLLRKRIGDLQEKSEKFIRTIGGGFANLNLTFQMKNAQILIKNVGVIKESDESKGKSQKPPLLRESSDRDTYVSLRDGMREFIAIGETIKKVSDYFRNNFEILTIDQLEILSLKIKSDKHELGIESSDLHEDDSEDYLEMAHRNYANFIRDLDSFNTQFERRKTTIQKWKEEAKGHVPESTFKGLVGKLSSGDTTEIEKRKEKLEKQLLQKEQSSPQVKSRKFSTSDTMPSRKTSIETSTPNGVFELPQNLTSAIENAYIALANQTPSLVAEWSAAELEYEYKGASVITACEKNIEIGQKLLRRIELLESDKSLPDKQLKLLKYLVPEQAESLSHFAECKINISEEIKDSVDKLRYMVEKCETYIKKIEEKAPVNREEPALERLDSIETKSDE